MESKNFVCPNCGAPITVSLSVDEKSMCNTQLRNLAVLLKQLTTKSSIAFKSSEMNEEFVNLMNEIGGDSSVPEIVELYGEIINQGAIADEKLYRRFVMSQMFHILHENELFGKPISTIIRKRGVKYMCKMIRDEYKAQAKMERNKDYENLKERNVYFNNYLPYKLFSDFYSDLRETFEKSPRRKTRGSGTMCVKVHGCHWMLKEDFEKNILKAIESLAIEAKNFNENTSKELVSATVNKFCDIASFNFDTYVIPRCWIDAYKGAGALFTLKNMLLCQKEHTYTLPQYELSKEEAWKEVKKLVCINDCDNNKKPLEGFELLGFLRDVIEHNKIRFSKLFCEWAEARYGKS